MIVSDAALAGLSPAERHRVLRLLQSATIDGGVHLVQALAGRDNDALAEIRSCYRGWRVEVDRSADKSTAFLATKAAH